jgi:hypothetical protein
MVGHITRRQVLPNDRTPRLTGLAPAPGQQETPALQESGLTAADHFAVVAGEGRPRWPQLMKVMERVALPTLGPGCVYRVVTGSLAEQRW